VGSDGQTIVSVPKVTDVCKKPKDSGSMYIYV